MRSLRLGDVGDASSHAVVLPGVRVGSVLRLRAGGEWRPGDATVVAIDGDVAYLGTPLNCLIPAACNGDEIVVVGRRAEPGEVLLTVLRQSMVATLTRWSDATPEYKAECARLETALRTGILEEP